MIVFKTLTTFSFSSLLSEFSVDLLEYLVFSKSRNDIARYPRLGILHQLKSVKLLRCLHISHIIHKITLTDSRNVLKYPPHSQSPEERERGHNVKS